MRELLQSGQERPTVDAESPWLSQGSQSLIAANSAADVSCAYGVGWEYSMLMGNYLSEHRVQSCTMSTTQPTFGIRHLTVVPTNLDAVETADQSMFDERDATGGDDG